jgi:hypothetical protein
MFQPTQSSFTLHRINWVSLLAFIASALLIGNGVRVNQLRNSNFLLDAIELDTHTKNLTFDMGAEYDCLYTSLAIAYKLAIFTRQYTRAYVKHCFEFLSNPTAISTATRILKQAIYNAGETRNTFDTSDYHRPGDVKALETCVKHVWNHVAVYVCNQKFEPLKVFQPETHDMEIRILYDQEKQHYKPLIRFDMLNRQGQGLNPTTHQEARSFVKLVQDHQKQIIKKNNIHRKVTPKTQEKLDEELENLQPRLTRRSQPDTEYNTHVGYLDMETEQQKYKTTSIYTGCGEDETASLLDNGGSSEQMPLMTGWCIVSGKEHHKIGSDGWPQLTPQDVHITTGYDCNHQFLKWLSTYEMPQRPRKDVDDGAVDKPPLPGRLVMYAHNGGKFDYVLLLRALLEEPSAQLFRITELLPRGSGFLSLTVKRVSDNSQIIFRDTMHHLAGSLDRLCNDFKPPHRKQTGAVDYDSFNAQLIKDNPTEFKKWRDYLEADILSMAEIFENYRHTIYNNYQVDITSGRVYTAATLSKRIFLSRYYNYNQPIWTLSPDAEQFVREAYHGGRTEVFEHCVENQPVYYYDFTSLYPYEMCKPIPIGKGDFQDTISLRAIQEDHAFGFVQVRIKTDYTHSNYSKTPPFIGLTASDAKASECASGKLVFGDFPEFTTVNLFTEEVCYILKHNLPYMFEHEENLHGYTFVKANVLQKFSQDMFARKRDADQPTERKVAKITVNSGYGFWGMRRVRETLNTVPLQKEEDAEKAAEELESGLYSHMFMCNGMMFAKSAAIATSTTIVPSISAAITAYARMTLHKLMMDIVSHGGRVLYCDTDSVITNLKFEGHPYFESLMGKHLGGLTNELEDYPDKCATDFIAIAPKMYALYNRQDREKYQSQAHKGLRKMRFEHMKQLWEQGVSYTETQMQFKFDQTTLYSNQAPMVVCDRDLKGEDREDKPIASLVRTNPVKEITIENVRNSTKRTLDDNHRTTHPVKVRRHALLTNKYVFSND